MGRWPKDDYDTSLEERMNQLDELDKEVENCPLMQAGREAREYERYIATCQSVTLSADSESTFSQPILPEKGNSRARRLDRYTNQIVAAGMLRRTEDGRTFAYQESQGYFRMVSDPVSYLAKQLPENVTTGLLVRDIKEILERASWKGGAECSLDDFNSCPTRVNLANGVLDLETDQIHSHDPCYQFTYCIKAKYLKESEDISCPEFDRFCTTSLDGDASKRQLLLEFIGYVCLDTTAGKCAMFLKGQPNSGKSVMLDFIMRLFDDEMVSNIPLHELGDKFHRAELAARKLNAADEIAGKPLRDCSIFKSVTSGKRMLGQFKNEDPFYFYPHCKLMFAGNTLPQTTDLDATAAFVNRLKVLLFNNSIDPKDQDKALPDKLWAERDSIVTLALQAAKRLAERNFEFTQPEDSKKFLASFELRGNVLGQFLEECCILGPECRVFNKELYEAYVAFCEENGYKCGSRQVLYEQLSGFPHIYSKRIRIGTENRQGHTGITLKTAEMPGTLEHQP